MKLRHTLYVVAFLLVILAATACGASPTATPTPKPTTAIVPTVPPTATAPKPTVAPTAVPTAAPPTATPVPAQATSKQLVNVRKGPGTQFDTAGRLPNNTTAVILGKSEDGKWYQIAFPDAANPTWVSAAFVTVTGPVDTLPVVAVAAPPTPTKGAVAATTKAPAATATIAVPPAKGVIGFVSFDSNQNSYILNNLVLGSATGLSGFQRLGTIPADLSCALNVCTNAAPFAWAPDGSGRVAWVYGPSGAQNVLTLTDNAGNNRSLAGHQGVSSPTWSPDAKILAYVGMDNSYGTQFLYTISSEGGTEQKPFAARQDRMESFRGVAWGKTHLLFVSNYTGQYEIWRLNSDFSGPMQLTNDKRENGAPAWSPDSSKFAYYSKQVDGSYQIMVANADGSSPRKLTNAGNNFTPAWSPDGNWIAFASNRGGKMDIYIMDKNGGNVKAVTTQPGDNQTPGSWR